MRILVLLVIYCKPGQLTTVPTIDSHVSTNLFQWDTSFNITNNLSQGCYDLQRELLIILHEAYIELLEVGYVSEYDHCLEDDCCSKKDPDWSTMVKHLHHM